MLSISKRICYTVGVLMLISVVTITVVSCALFYKRNSEMLAKECAVDQVVLESSLTTLYNNTGAVCHNLAEDETFCNAIGKGDKDTIVNAVNNYKGKQDIFCIVLDKSSKVIYSTGIDVASIDTAALKTGYVPNKSNTTLYYVIVEDVDNGQVITGVDMADSTLLDNIKSLTGAEVTVFADTTRLATTVVDDAGNRAVGTEMSDEVVAVVKDKLEMYNGTATIMGKKYQSTYYPLTTNGKYVGALFVGTSTAEGTQATVTAAMQSFVVGLLVLVLAGVYVIYYIKTRVAAPVISAHKLAEQMSQGNLEPLSITCKLSNDEVGSMFNTLTQTQQTLNGYIADITRVLAAMSAGDFTVKPTIQYAGAFVAIDSAFAGIREKLAQTITQMQATVDEVTAGATQIADGSQTLADGATRQAASIQELSATISDVASKIQHSAENASESDTCANDACNKVDKQAESMSEVHTAMTEIRDKSAQISTIIKAIEDIAFQTNILALNAAVEAARAGDAGKGFAVVADEVRNLASKSDAAAKQTSAIINETLMAVERGTAIVDETVSTVKSVTETTQHVSTLVRTIATEAEEQNVSIEQVNVGISQISEVIQQNSAAAEEFAASCEELNGQVEMLKAQIVQFKIGG